MVLFKSVVTRIRPEGYKFTFQYGSIQILFSSTFLERRKYLHSNMVLFKFAVVENFKTNVLNFTFQYGSIQIMLINQKADVIFYFTFQYGSIQILHIDWIHIAYYTFTFQYGSIQIIKHTFTDIISILYIPIWFYSNGQKVFITLEINVFTFQYGSIQIDMLKFCDEKFQDFTFQYGSIQINVAENSADRERFLYIPIWFYSNATGLLLRLRCPGFTFQYGSIQMVNSLRFLQIWRTLHSNMVLFK